MNRWQKLGCVGLVVLAAPTGAAEDSPRIESALLRADDLEGVGKNSGVRIVGFSWQGEARRFDAEPGDNARPRTETGEQSLSILGGGAAAVCEGLKARTSAGHRLAKARLVLKRVGGGATAFKLAGVTSRKIDCGAKPWSAILVAEEVTAVSSKEKAKGLKKQGEAVRMERVGSGG